MTVTNFIWDELSDNVLLETDENDVVTASYTNRPERFGELLSQERSGVTSYFHYDGVHSTRNLTDSNEDVTDTFIYTAYGEEVSRTGTTTNPFGYKGAVGYYTNEVTDDVYVRNRTYEPAIGRWLSADPAESVDGTNLYRAYFVPNRVDASGLFCALCCCCAEDIDISNIWPWDESPYEYVANPEDFIGNVFEVDVTTKVIPTDILTGPCKLKWEEKMVHSIKCDNFGLSCERDVWPDHYTFSPKKIGTWYDIFELLPHLDIFKKWVDYYAKWAPPICPPAPKLIRDAPATNIRGYYYVKRIVEWRLSVASSPGCDCDYSQVGITARQVLEYRWGNSPTFDNPRL